MIFSPIYHFANKFATVANESRPQIVQKANVVTKDSSHHRFKSKQVKKENKLDRLQQPKKPAFKKKQ